MPATILMVNLAAGMQEFLEEEWGDRCHFVSVSDTLELAQHIVDADFDAIVTNYSLPRVSALDLARSIRNGEATREVPIAIFTKDADAKSVQECRDAGASLLVSAKTPKSHVTTWLDRIISEREQAEVPPELDQSMGAAIQSATAMVMDTALGMAVTDEGMEIGPSGDQAAEIVASVSVTGFLTGVITLFMGMELARTVARRMIGMEAEETLDDWEAIDAVGELANLIAGKIKTNLCMKRDLFFLGTPSVVVGREVRRMPLEKHLAVRQLCGWQSHRLLVELSFVPNKRTSRRRAGQLAR